MTRCQTRSRRRLQSKLSPRSERVVLTTGEGKDIEDEELQEVISETHGKRTQGSSSPKFGPKRTALLCALSIMFTPSFTDACPDMISMSIDTSICTNLKTFDQVACSINHKLIIENPLTLLCNNSTVSLRFHRPRKSRSTTERKVGYPSFTLIKDIPTLVSLTPFWRCKS